MIPREIESHERARHILSLLKRHGPLTLATLLQIIEPPMRKRRLRDSLARLIKRNFVQRRYEGQGNARSSFYQLTQEDGFHKKLANYIGGSPDELKQRHFSYRELYHNHDCALIANQLTKLYPDALIVRDFELISSQIAQKLLLYNDKLDDLRPDVMLIFPPTKTSAPLAIAFEIEKTRKSNKRLILKLKKYAQESHVDGVVYICESTRLSEIIRQNYLDRVLARVSRVKRYRNQFLTFSIPLAQQFSKVSQLINAKCETNSLEEWIFLIHSIKNETVNTYPPKTSALYG